MVRGGVLAAQDAAPSVSVRPRKRSPWRIPSWADGRFGRLGWLLLAIIIGTLVGLPTFRVIGPAFADGGVGFQAANDVVGIRATLIRSLALGVMSAALATGLGLSIALAVASLHGRRRMVAGVLPVVPIIMPAPVMVMGFAFLLSPRVGYLNQLLRTTPFFDHLQSGPVNVYSLPWIILITALFLSSFTYLFIAAALQDVGPQYQAAASVSGAGPARTLFAVTLPLLRPALAYAFGIAIVLGVGQFTAPLLLGRRDGINVISTEIYRASENYPVDFALGGALSTPLIAVGVLVLLAQRKAIGDSRRFVVGRGDTAVGATSGRGIGRLLMLGGYSIFLLLPFVAIAHVAFSEFWRGQLTFSDYTLANVREVLGNERFLRSLSTSLVSTVVALVVVIPITFLAALAIGPGSRCGKTLRTAIELFVSAPLGIPATVIGFGALFAYSEPPFRLYGTYAVIILVYITIMLPFSMRLQLASLYTIGTSYRDAAATAGASPLRSLLRITVPLARTGIVSSIGLTFVLLMHEFGASLLVSAPGREVLGRLLYEYYSYGIYPEAATLGLALVGITIVGLLVVALSAAPRRRSKKSPPV